MRMTRPTASLALVVVGAGLLAACGNDSKSSKPPAETPELSAEVRRTSFGIPHVKADNEKGLGYGLGYAFAQDNICLLADVIVTANGERSKYFGGAGTYDRQGGGSHVTNLPSDFYYKYLNDSESVQAMWDGQATENRDLLTGYAAGYNRYLRETGAAGLPDACRNQDWVRAITPLDLIRLMRLYTSTASGGAFINYFYSAQPPVATVAARKAEQRRLAAVTGKRAAQARLAYTPAPAGFWEGMKNRLGSNGVALGKDATESGKGLLLANPHFPWSSAYRFYQMHLTIPGKVDVMGASLSGLPIVNIGFNNNVAWTHTVNEGRHFNLFHLELDSADPTRYKIDGVTKDMTRRELSVEVQGAADPVKRTFYLTELGPVAVIPGVLAWTTTAAYAFADANLENDRMLTQWWAMNRATSMDEFRAAVEDNIGTPWVNTIAADKDGNTYLADVTPVPNLSAAKLTACVPAPFQPLIASQGIYVLAGSNSACHWEDDPSAPQKGIFPASKLPTLSRSDYVQNSNDSAWLTNPRAPLTGFPTIVSKDAYQQNARTRIGIHQIEARLAGSDGRAGNRFNVKSLQDIAFSNRSWYALSMLPGLRTACADGDTVTVDGGDADISRGCAVLSAWDGRAEVDSIGWPLFNEWRTRLAALSSNYWTTSFDAADPVATPAGLRISDPAVRLAARQAVARAMKALDDQGVNYELPWGQLQYRLVGTRQIPVHGGVGSDIYNAMRGGIAQSGGLPPTFYGSSIVMTVSYETGAPQAEGFLTYSQSTNPASPHHADQTERFSNKDWIRLPFTEAAIKADAGYSTVSLSE